MPPPPLVHTFCERELQDIEAGLAASEWAKDYLVGLHAPGTTVENLNPGICAALVRQAITAAFNGDFEVEWWVAHSAVLFPLPPYP